MLVEGVINWLGTNAVIQIIVKMSLEHFFPVTDTKKKLLRF